jgi:hypothetical protein
MLVRYLEVFFMKNICIVLLLLFSINSFVYSEDGVITYMSGNIELMRDGDFYDQYDLYVGFEIENFDQITTGSNGELWIELTSLSGSESELKISSGTTFYIEMSKIDDKNTTTIGMITGSLFYSVQKLLGTEQYEIETDAATMGVRGTSFGVQTSVAGDVLITCEEGRVACYDPDGGPEYFAEPGNVVERQADATFRSIPVAISDIESFRSGWITERISAFKANALRVIQQFAARYKELRNEFNTEFEALMTETTVLNKWFSEHEDGEMGSRMERMRERREIIGHLFDLKRILFIFERIYYRLLELRSYHEEGFGRGALADGTTTTQFFNMLENERRELARRVAMVRFVMKLYTERSDAESIISF